MARVATSLAVTVLKDVKRAAMAVLHVLKAVKTVVAHVAVEVAVAVAVIVRRKVSANVSMQKASPSWPMQPRHP